MKELPIPRFDKTNDLHKKIFTNSAMLICTTDEYKELRNKIGISNFTTNPVHRLTLEAQINAAAAKTCDLTKDELNHIFKKFPSDKLKPLQDLTLEEFSLL
jgi:hypothetical protein